MAAIVPFYADSTFTNGNTLTGGTADVVIVIDESAYSSTQPWPPALPPVLDYDDELKAITRELRREESLAAQGWLSSFRHTRRPAPGPEGVAARPPRPTQRRTATATKNWRRR